MEISSSVDSIMSTNIIVRDEKGKKLHDYDISNTITKTGRNLLHSFISSPNYIDGMVLSEQTNTGATQDMPSDAIISDISDTYFTISGNDILFNFEANYTPDDLGGNKTIRSIGLAQGNNLFSVASAGSIIAGSTAISILYQIKITLTQA